MKLWCPNCEILAFARVRETRRRRHDRRCVRYRLYVLACCGRRKLTSEEDLGLWGKRYIPEDAAVTA